MSEKFQPGELGRLGEKARKLEEYRRSIEGMKRNLNPRAPNYLKEIRRLDNLMAKKLIELNASEYEQRQKASGE